MTICRVAGIVAEYNPLHRGHAYHMEETKRILKAEALVVALSSDFLQRGEPACVNKWTRTTMALESGADLVLELPALFSCHNASVFANAGVDILAATGVVTHLSFGMENPEVPLEPLADILLQEPPHFKTELRGFLDLGLSYAEARSRALKSCLCLQGERSLLSGKAQQHPRSGIRQANPGEGISPGNSAGLPQRRGISRSESPGFFQRHRHPEASFSGRDLPNPGASSRKLRKASGRRSSKRALYHEF